MEQGRMPAPPRRRPGGEARGWRSPSPKRREKGRKPEVPEKRAAATYGRERGGETEVNVPEEEGAACSGV